MQISLENLYVDTGVTKLLSFSSAEASLCRREAGEREKERARAGDYPDLDGETSPVWVYCAGPGCSKLGYDNPGLVRNLNSDMKAWKVNSV